MLATFIIGLREGLEAALIVGIIAAFLRNNGRSLAGMWLGVALAVLLSIGVGVGLKLAEQALPQADQEALETVVGVIAVFFVTGMIVWMNAHARDMKRQLESNAASALRRSGTLALAAMAFLAVLKEGFETSVFLLATFSAAQSAMLAAAGAFIGLLVAVAIGWGIYVGGVRFNLARFFRYTAAFLILVAAGLVIASLRTAHEAGWIVAGQQPTLNLAWLVALGTIQSALITGVLGIPADPRLIEVIGWLAYLIPVTLFVYWPPSHRPLPRTTVRIKTAIAAVLAASAVVLVLAWPRPHLEVSSQAGLQLGDEAPAAGTAAARFAASSNDGPAMLRVSLPSTATHSLSLSEANGRKDRHRGVEATVWTVQHASTPADAPSTLSLPQVVKLSDGRVPVGLDPQQHPGPFSAAWAVHAATRVWSSHGVLLDAIGRSTTTVTLSGGRLQTPRTIRVADNGLFSATSDWRVTPAYVDHTVRALRALSAEHTERRLWALQLPIVLALIALWLSVSAWRGHSKLFRARDTDSGDPELPPGPDAGNPGIKGVLHAAS